jgi:hypothetical protein
MSVIPCPSGKALLEEHCTAEELPACLAVLQHAYTGRLPAAANVTLLCRVRGWGGVPAPFCLPACQFVCSVPALGACTVN